MDAALDLLADRGEEGVTLRELTDAADANVAAVSYHFGSLKSLCDAAIEAALERYLDAQQEAVSALDPDEATLETLAAAFAQPMMSALAAGGREFATMRIVARAGIDPPRGWDRLSRRFDQIRADVLRVLRANVPAASDRELIFRTRCAAGLLNWLVLAPVGADLRNTSRKQVERLLVPAVAGTFQGLRPVR
jgi:AcrR family transcriptional regulator